MGLQAPLSTRACRTISKVNVPPARLCACPSCGQAFTIMVNHRVLHSNSESQLTLEWKCGHSQLHVISSPMALSNPLLKNRGAILRQSSFTDKSFGLNHLQKRPVSFPVLSNDVKHETVSIGDILKAHSSVISPSSRAELSEGTF